MRGALLPILLCGCLQAYAADEPLAEAGETPSVLHALNLNGSLRGSYWNISDNPAGRNNPGIAELWLKAAPKPGENSALLLEGWTRAADVAHSAGRQSALREGYVNFSHGAADFRIGKQIIVWGRADQINPTDNLTPRDNTLFIAESDDQRLGTVAAKVTWNFPDIAAGHHTDIELYTQLKSDEALLTYHNPLFHKLLRTRSGPFFHPLFQQ